MKYGHFYIWTNNLFSSIFSPCVSWGSERCSISNGLISKGCIIPLIASFKSFVRAEWWWGGSMRAVMKPPGAAQWRDLRETEGNIQLLPCSWLASWHVTGWVIEDVRLLLLMVAFDVEKEAAEISRQCAALVSGCVLVLSDFPSYHTSVSYKRSSVIRPADGPTARPFPTIFIPLLSSEYKIIECKWKCLHPGENILQNPPAKNTI